MIAFATPNEVITQVTCVIDTPRSPPMDDNDTFAIEVSSTFMNVASDSDRVPRIFAAPVSGAGSSVAAMGVRLQPAQIAYGDSPAASKLCAAASPE